MRTFDFTPFHRTTVGFDRLFDMLDTPAARPDWPPYNIEKFGENEYRITMAIAGFSLDEVELVQHGPELSIVGQKKPNRPNDSSFITASRCGTSNTLSGWRTT